MSVFSAERLYCRFGTFFSAPYPVNEYKVTPQASDHGNGHYREHVAIASEIHPICLLLPPTQARQVPDVNVSDIA